MFNLFNVQRYMFNLINIGTSDARLITMVMYRLCLWLPMWFVKINLQFRTCWRVFIRIRFASLLLKPIVDEYCKTCSSIAVTQLLKNYSFILIRHQRWSVSFKVDLSGLFNIDGANLFCASKIASKVAVICGTSKYVLQYWSQAKKKKNCRNCSFIATIIIAY